MVATMPAPTKDMPAPTLAELAAVCTATGTLWVGDKCERLYLKSDGCFAIPDGCYVWLDSDGDFIGEGPKLSRAVARRVWGPWDAAARAIGARLYA